MQAEYLMGMDMAHRLGIIGYGGMAPQHRQRVSAISVKGAYDVREKRSKRAASRAYRLSVLDALLGPRNRSGHHRDAERL